MLYENITIFVDIKQTDGLEWQGWIMDSVAFNTRVGVIPVYSQLAECFVYLDSKYVWCIILCLV